MAIDHSNMLYNDSSIINNIRMLSLTREHDLKSFCCGNDEIDDFLKNYAITDQEDKLSRTYLVFLDNGGVSILISSKN